MMKKFNSYMLGCGLFASLLLASACSDFTDIQPKGKNLLSKTSDLELLLNYPHGISASDMQTVCGDMAVLYDEQIPTLLSSPKKTITSILLSWDEAGHDKELIELRRTDDWYVKSYEMIGKIANPILKNVESSEGDDFLKSKIKAEAFVLRAWYHFLLVQKYAKAYDPATAASDRGIIYMTEDMDIKKSHSQSTVAEVYDKILSDIDAAIATDGLPDLNVNRMRVSLPCAYALKALVQMCMQRYDDAAADARRALAINSTVVDYNTMTKPVQGYILGMTYNVLFREPLECAEDYFDVYTANLYNWLTPFAESMFETGHAVKEKMYTQDTMYDYCMNAGEMTIGLPWTGTFDLDSSWNNLGFKTTQMYLVLAESEIHNGSYDSAMASLDVIREKRIDPLLYAPLAGGVSDKATAIRHLKETAHGENIYTVWNFVNRKRWCLVDDFKETFTREIDGKTYTLTPESKMWIFPFPTNIMAVNPNLKNNF